MEAGWAGFSDADLRKLKHAKVRKNSTNSATQPPAAFSRAPASVTPVSAPSVVSRQREGNKIPKAASTTAPAMTVSPVAMETKVSSSTNEEPEKQELNATEGISRELDNLDKFREQQKQIEEANKQKKLLLARTLSERQKKAKEEAQKLSQIQKDLVKLDNLLTADVTLIRDRIENSSREFVEAQKRYDKAEKEFIEAKLNLQRKSELKEQLTEHLYTVIHQNEVRKANKLQELMSELEIESSSSEVISLNSLPPLSSFGIHDVNTLHSPLTSPTSSTPQVPSPQSSGFMAAPASSAPEPASSSTQKPSPDLQPTSSNCQPHSSVALPSSSVSLSKAQQIGFKQETFATENDSSNSIKSETNFDKNSKENFPTASKEQLKNTDCKQKKNNSTPKIESNVVDTSSNLDSQETVPNCEVKYNSMTIIKKTPSENMIEATEEVTSRTSTVTSASYVSRDMVQLPNSWTLSLVEGEPND